MIDLNHQPKFHEQVSMLLDAALQAERSHQARRRYLGASRLGVHCERALQYEYVDAPVDDGAELPQDGQAVGHLRVKAPWVSSASTQSGLTLRP